MKVAAAAVVALGAALIVAGVALVHWPSALIVAGVLLAAAGLPLPGSGGRP